MNRFPRAVRSLVGAAVLLVGVAGGVVVSAGAAEQEQQAPISRQAYFTYPATQVLPPVLLNGFPPSTACLVAGLVGVAQVCGEEVAGIGNDLGLSDGIPVVPTPDADIAQPIAPGTSPVGMLGGQQRWVSLFQLALPAPPAGEQFGSLEIVFHQDGLNFAFESPAFRDAVLTAISQVSAQDPAQFAALVQRIAGEDVPVFTETITGLEACPVKEGWNAGDAQNAGQGGSRVPAVNCVLGSTAVYDPEQQTFTFDLTFAAQAWTTGGPDGDVLPNEGFLIRPVGAPNLAYGDPDFSTNWLVSLADNEAAENLRPRIRYTTVPDPDAGGDLDLDLGLDTGGDAPVPFFPDTALDLGTVPAPVVTPPASRVVQVSGDFTARWGERKAVSSNDVSGWTLLLIPLALAGAFVFGEALMAQPGHLRRRTGALTELMRARDPSDVPDPREGI